MQFIEEPEAMLLKENGKVIYKAHKRQNNKGFICTLPKAEDIYYEFFITKKVKDINAIDVPDNFKYSKQVFEYILTLKVSDLPNHILINSPVSFEDNSFLHNFEIFRKNEKVLLLCSRKHDVKNWTKHFSPSEFTKFLINDFKSETYSLRRNGGFEVELVIEISTLESKSKIFDIISKYTNILETYYDQSLEKLSIKTNENIFIKIFDFPDKYKNIYSQYLVWFGEFLENLGIIADVHTEPSNGQTALIVSPTNAPELLDEIEKLFYQYLQLPYVEVLPPQREMSVQEQHTLSAIKQQMQMLDMQVQAKDSLLLNSNATIASLNTTVARQANLIETQADKLTLLNALEEKDKWSKVPFTEGTFKCKNFGKKTMSIQFEPLALYNKLIDKKNKSNKDDE